MESNPQQLDLELQTAMIAVPEFAESREWARNARAEGRPGTAAEVLADFAARYDTGEGVQMSVEEVIAEIEVERTHP